MASAELDAELHEIGRLWLPFISARSELTARKILRTNRDAKADLAEWLVGRVFNGSLMPSKVHPWYDVQAGDQRIQVRSVAKAAGNKNGYIVKTKDRNNDWTTGATHYAFVFCTNLIPDTIYLVDEAFVRLFPKRQIKRADLTSYPHAVVVDVSPFFPARVG